VTLRVLLPISSGAQDVFKSWWSRLRSFYRTEPLVTCYYFYIHDRRIGPAFIKVCAYSAGVRHALDEPPAAALSAGDERTFISAWHLALACFPDHPPQACAGSGELVFQAGDLLA
jgi:hypothetical protein